MKKKRSVSPSPFAVLLATLLAGCGDPVPNERRPVDPLPPADVVHSREASDLVATPERLVTRAGKPIEAARKRAQGLLRHAAEKSADPRERALLGTMESALSHARIDVPPPGHDTRACAQDARALAFVSTLDPNVIHVCARAAGASESRLGQVLVHETAHVVGVHDECDATRIEVAVERASSARLPFRNGYMRRCGID